MIIDAQRSEPTGRRWFNQSSPSKPALVYWPACLAPVAVPAVPRCRTFASAFCKSAPCSGWRRSSGNRDSTQPMTLRWRRSCRRTRTQGRMALMARTVDVVVSDWMFAAVQRAEDNLSLVRPDPLPSATVDALLDDVMLPRGVRQLRSAGTPRQPAGHAGAVL